jgi:hypothetical protein
MRQERQSPSWSPPLDSREERDTGVINFDTRHMFERRLKLRPLAQCRRPIRLQTVSTLATRISEGVR